VTAGAPTPAPELLDAIGNLSRFHRDHEQFYSQAPLRQALELQACSRALKALAAHWGVVTPTEHPLTLPFAGAEDLNAPGLVAETGILFMESDGEPAEIVRLKQDAERIAAGCEQTGEWLDGAMQQAWQMAAALVPFADLADLLGERHRIISNDWQAAGMNSMAARTIRRALDLLEQVDFTPAALRADLSGPRRASRYLLASSELIDHGADLLTASSMLVHGNERRWRIFADRVKQLRQARQEAES
jgi:hypothetical protein